jgi:hypothetical protein
MVRGLGDTAGHFARLNSDLRSSYRCPCAVLSLRIGGKEVNEPIVKYCRIV